LRPGFGIEEPRRAAKKLATSISAVRVVIPMASNADRARSRRASRSEAQRPTADSSDVKELLPWWSKLVHQMLLADGVASGGNEDGNDREDRCVASGSPRVRIRAAVDAGTGVRARRVD
jgi:hypothetical protein